MSGRITEALCRGLKTRRVDVVSLVDAPLLLRYRIVRDGVLVVCRDAAILERFVVETVLYYLDFKPVRDRAFGLKSVYGKLHVHSKAEAVSKALRHGIVS